MNSTRLNESSAATLTKSSRVGGQNKVNGTIVKVKVDFDDYRILAPVYIPDLADVRVFAQRLHAQQQPWQGEAFGWNAGYTPCSPEPPPDSKMSFTPADFWIGDGAIWFFALMWENGEDQPPVETVYDQNMVGVLESW